MKNEDYIKEMLDDIDNLSDIEFLELLTELGIENSYMYERKAK